MSETAIPIWQLVIADMHGRDLEGRREYGEPLTLASSIDGLQYAYEECLDQAVYLRREIERRKAILMSLEGLEGMVITWADERGLFEGSSPRAQWEKTREEVGELGDAIDAEDAEGIKDGIGDTLVTLIVQANMQGLTLTECLTHAYSQIKDRRGKIVDGMFVKEEGSG